MISLCTTSISQSGIHYRKWLILSASTIISPRGLTTCLDVFATYNCLFLLLFIDISSDHPWSSSRWDLDCSWEATRGLSASFSRYEKGNWSFYPGWSYKKIVGILFLPDRCVAAGRWGSRAVAVVVKLSHWTWTSFCFL